MASLSSFFVLYCRGLMGGISLSLLSVFVCAGEYFVEFDRDELVKIQTSRALVQYFGST
jgi:hypothetical protein